MKAGFEKVGDGTALYLLEEQGLSRRLEFLALLVTSTGLTLVGCGDQGATMLNPPHSVPCFLLACTSLPLDVEGVAKSPYAG
jgi:hypothetical protein